MKKTKKQTKNKIVFKSKKAGANTVPKIARSFVLQKNEKTLLEEKATLAWTWKKRTEKKPAKTADFKASKGFFDFPTSSVFAKVKESAPINLHNIVSAQRVYAKGFGPESEFQNFLKNNTVLVLSGLAVLAIFAFLSPQFFSPSIDPALLIKTAQTQKQSPIVAESTPVQWTTLIKRSDITQSNYLLKLPKQATNIKITEISKNQATAILNQTPPALATLTTQDRKQLAKLSTTNNTLFASLLDSVKFLFADLEESVSNVIETISEKDKDKNKIKKTKDAKIVDLTSELSADNAEVTPSDDGVEQAPATGSNDLISEPGEVRPPENLNAAPVEVGPQPVDDYVQVTYETPAPTITEQETDNGKLVTVSDGSPSTSSGQAQLTDVLAFTKIPEIYKTGQEDKIKIKWTNPSTSSGQAISGEQDMDFQAFDLDNNGKLDYVEWTVPHLSDQYFEIIFISKAFELNQNKEIINDIYDIVVAKDNTWATIPSGHYVRATFEQILDNTKDVTLYARPASAWTSPEFIGGQVPRVEVWAQAPSNFGSNDIYEEQLVAVFASINREATYKVYLTDLQTPTDVFDLKVVGNLEIDWVVDPVTCVGTITDTCVELDLSNCALVAGCSLGSYTCQGTHDACDTYTVAGEAECTAYHICSWQAAAVAYCTDGACIMEEACTGANNGYCDNGACVDQASCEGADNGYCDDVDCTNQNDCETGTMCNDYTPSVWHPSTNCASTWNPAVQDSCYGSPHDCQQWECDGSYFGCANQ